MATYVVKKRDTAPVVSDTLLDGDGVAVNLSGATVAFHMTDWTRSTVVIASGSATGPSGGALDSSGVVEYAWQTNDVAAAGIYRAEWQVTFAGGKVETWPNDGMAVVEIVEDLA